MALTIAQFNAFRKEGVYAKGYPSMLRVLYAPVDDLHGALVHALSAASTTLSVAMYALEDQELGDILNAKCSDPTVAVQLSLDASMLTYSSEPLVLAREKFPNTSLAVGHSEKNAIMHLKVAVIDGEWTIHGSTNWSGSGQTRQDNELVIVKSAQVAQDMTARLDKLHAYLLTQPQPQSLESLRAISASSPTGF